MRKFLTIVLITTVIASVGCLFGTGYTDAKSGLYPETAIIVELDRAENLVTVADVAGNIWEFYGCEDYYEGNLVRMLMYDGGTPNTIYDDEIVIVWYAGTLEQFADAYAEYWRW